MAGALVPRRTSYGVSYRRVQWQSTLASVHKEWPELVLSLGDH